MSAKSGTVNKALEKRSLSFENSCYERLLHNMHYTTHTTEVEKSKIRWFEQVVTAKRTLENTILQDKVKVKRSHKTVVGRCKGMTMAELE